MKNTFLQITTHNLAWLIARQDSDELALKPPFQRNPVWTEKQKSYLIDTILHGYPVPELYLQEFADKDGKQKYVVVDGQQRLRACFEYVSGQFAIDPKDSPKWGDLFFDDLGDDDKLKLFNYTFVVRVLPDLSDDQIREIFHRLNRNTVTLNNQELRHATYWGEFISTVEKIANFDHWQATGVFTPNDVRRMLDAEFVSELVIGHLHGVQNKKSSLDKWYAAYEENFELKDDTLKRFSATLGELVATLPTISKTRWNKKSDFYSLFLVMLDASDKFPLSSDQRTALATALTTFGSSVDAFIKSKDPAASTEVKRYAGAVEKAASDLGSRRIRRDELLKIAAPCIGL